VPVRRARSGAAGGDRRLHDRLTPLPVRSGAVVLRGPGCRAFDLAVGGSAGVPRHADSAPADVVSEQFTLADAAVVNQFARAHGVGQLSMWSLNRDSTCGPPLPSVLAVVQTGCSGIDQDAQRFANVLATNLVSLPSLPSRHHLATEERSRPLRRRPRPPTTLRRVPSRSGTPWGGIRRERRSCGTSRSSRPGTGPPASPRTHR